jgi:pyridoxamine 5'-phosphate oxidase
MARTVEPGRMGPVTDYGIPLLENDLDGDPLRQFASWFGEAAAAGVREPHAAALATATAGGVPSVRVVLVKALDERGFVFFSDYASRKGRELAVNPRAALLFHWDPLGRQVRIEGPVERTSAEESVAYIRTRPRSSQVSALASPQSQTIESREELERRVADLERRYAGSDLPMPSSWGGYRLAPETLEFWQQRHDRLHDRLSFRRAGEGWRVERLAP